MTMPGEMRRSRMMRIMMKLRRSKKIPNCHNTVFLLCHSIMQ
jgi:hypothetical protein